MHGKCEECCGGLRMNDLRPGECGKVIDVRGGGMFLRRRLLEMGILGGTHFKVQRIAPLGDPMEIRLRGSSISLRLREAHHIVVERV